MHTLNVVWTFIIVATTSAFGQSIDTALSFYPLGRGDEWTYAYLPNFLAANPRLYTYTLKVEGDTTMPNGRTYKIISFQTSGHNWGNYAFQRIDSTTACVYQSDVFGAFETLFNSLLAPPNTVAGSIGTYDFVIEQAVFQNIRQVRHYGSLTQRAYELASGIGIIHIREYVGPMQLPYIHILTDAKINGTVYHLVTTIDRAFEQLPHVAELYQNYPNPFNPLTQIDFLVRERELVELRVYDMIGREIALLKSETMDPGLYSVTFDGSGLSTGVYHCRLNTGSSTFTKKMILIK
ncbi:MAG: T9SS type A sorting domain-containing protein [Acidobacteriota bacterium]